MKVHVVGLRSETISLPVSVRAYLNQTVAEFKQLIAQVRCPGSFPAMLAAHRELHPRNNQPPPSTSYSLLLYYKII